MMKMRAVRSLAVLGVFCSVLMACETTHDLNPFYGSKVIVPDCPKVRLLQDADKVTVYRPGPGRDITDILYEAKLLGFLGIVNMSAKTVSFMRSLSASGLNLNWRGGLPDSTRIAELKYFVAIPEFFPAPEARDNL